MSIKTRLTILEHQFQVEEGDALPESGGLASLLAYAEKRGLRALPPIPDEDLPTTGLGQALREARAWHRRQAEGAV